MRLILSITLLLFSCGEDATSINNNLVLFPELHSLNSTCQQEDESPIITIPGVTYEVYECETKHCVKLILDYVPASVTCKWK